MVGVPFSLYAVHRTLFLPVPLLVRSLVYSHYEVYRKYRLRIVAESTQKFYPLNLRIAHLPHGGTAFICKTLAEVQQNMALAFGKCKARYARSGRRRYFGFDIIFSKAVGIVSRSRALAVVFAAIFLVIDVKSTRRRHQQQAAEFGASHTA